MVTADYTFYISTYGGTLAEATFNASAMRAAHYVDSMIFGRVPKPNQTDAVKMAICSVVDAMTKTANGVIQSATNDGYTESYAVTATAEQTIFNAAYIFLARTGLLFRGGLARC